MKLNRALVIGGTELEQGLYLDQLTSLDIDCCATSCFNEAQQVIEASANAQMHVNLIIMDQETSSFRQNIFIQYIRNHYTIEDLPIMVLGPSAFINHEVAEFEDVIQIKLVKPVAPSDFARNVNDLLNCKATPDSEQERYDTLEAQMSDTNQEYGIDILIAEDNEVNQIVFTQTLADLDVTFEIANNGEEAVELWKKFSPALVLMDVSMPVMNGHQATREIRKIEEGMTRRTPICAITAHALAGDREACIAAGMDDHMSKPIGPNALIAKVKNLLPASHPDHEPEMQAKAS